ncbi:hypothetical protein BpHYR1_049070 [Brachionus plicatilis]|uniref:Uncharacterized protein n=1 Tax=Brachionus plicatilis TaxID=10195 RepID=A0A3M7SPQ4_BRAPC|nr:hypothetical protein BpHYR1_049070 [Brachionus plicatilis]
MSNDKNEFIESSSSESDSSSDMSVNESVPSKTVSFEKYDEFENAYRKMIKDTYQLFNIVKEFDTTPNILIKRFIGLKKIRQNLIEKTILSFYSCLKPFKLAII